jgi:hypothetical protein
MPDTALRQPGLLSAGASGRLRLGFAFLVLLRTQVIDFTANIYQPIHCSAAADDQLAAARDDASGSFPVPMSHNSNAVALICRGAALDTLSAFS